MSPYPFDDLLPGRPAAERARLTDEAVTALIDGELDPFAADLGLDPADVRQRLDAWPGLGARRAALEATRAALRAAPAPTPLDELTRRRLLATAVGGPASVPGPAPTRTRPRRSRWVVASVAAAVLVVVGVGAAIVTRHDDHGSKTAASKVAPVGYVGDLGDVTDPNTLRNDHAGHLGAPDRALASGVTTTTAPAGSSPQLATNGTTAPAAESKDATGSATPSPASTTAAPSTKSGAQRCATTIVDQNAPGSTVLLTATGVYKGRPAAIVTIDRGRRTVTFIADLDTCAVVGGQTGGSG